MTRKEISKETKFKEKAFHDLEKLRVEIQQLQSGDMSSISLWKENVSKLREQKFELGR